MTYVFTCKGCGEQFEVSASFSTISTLKTSCPFCKSDDVSRKYLPTRFTLKGKGFYKTDSQEENR